MAATLLVKQSALLLLVGPVGWITCTGLRNPQRRLQVVVGGSVVLALLLPWLHHNWITTLGGTNRAVVESAAAEGDPPVFSWASFSWYLRQLPAQLGPVLPLPALPVAVALLMGKVRRRLPPGWGWLIGCTVSGWLLTTLSPNKDGRYFTPVLPLLVILMAMAWWTVGWWLRDRWGRPMAWGMLLAGLAGAIGQAVAGAANQIQRSEPAPVVQLTRQLRKLVGDAPTTLLVVPGNPELNEQTVTTFGRLAGGRIEGRRLGRARHEHPLVLERSQWVLLATGDQGTDRPISRELSHRVRADGRFARVAAWPWNQGRDVELWRRQAEAAAVPFDADFVRLARGMEKGPAGVAALFARIGPEHQLDAHFLYQERVRRWAQQRLQRQPQDPDALWSLALMATLRNRPAEASHWYGALQAQNRENPWPLAYRAVVLLADWNPGGAHALLRAAPSTLKKEPVLQALEDLSGVLSGRLLRTTVLGRSVPRAITAVKQRLEEEKAAKTNPPR